MKFIKSEFQLSREKKDRQEEEEKNIENKSFLEDLSIFKDRNWIDLGLNDENQKSTKNDKELIFAEDKERFDIFNSLSDGYKNEILNNVSTEKEFDDIIEKIKIREKNDEYIYNKYGAVGTFFGDATASFFDPYMWAITAATAGLGALSYTGKLGNLAFKTSKNLLNAYNKTGNIAKIGIDGTLSGIENATQEFLLQETTLKEDNLDDVFEAGTIGFVFGGAISSVPKVYKYLKIKPKINEKIKTEDLNIFKLENDEIKLNNDGIKTKDEIIKNVDSNEYELDDVFNDFELGLDDFVKKGEEDLIPEVKKIDEIEEVIPEEVKVYSENINKKKPKEINKEVSSFRKEIETAKNDYLNGKLTEDEYFNYLNTSSKKVKSINVKNDIINSLKSKIDNDINDLKNKPASIVFTESINKIKNKLNTTIDEIFDNDIFKNNKKIEDFKKIDNIKNDLKKITANRVNRLETNQKNNLNTLLSQKLIVEASKTLKNGRLSLNEIKSINKTLKNIEKDEVKGKFKENNDDLINFTDKRIKEIEENNKKIIENERNPDIYEEVEFKMDEDNELFLTKLDNTIKDFKNTIFGEYKSVKIKEDTGGLKVDIVNNIKTRKDVKNIEDMINNNTTCNINI